jgi:hypothetical protein
MSKFTPFEKLSKKAKKEIAKKKRVTWGSFNPVTRRLENSKAYKRKKIRNWEDDYSTGLFLYL